jgi:hypothetical protein
MNIKGMYTELKTGESPADTHELFEKMYKQCKTDKALKPGEKAFISLLVLFGLCLSDLQVKNKGSFNKHLSDMKKMCDKNYSEELKDLSALHYDVINRLTAKDYSDSDIKLVAEEAMILHKMA